MLTIKELMFSIKIKNFRRKMIVLDKYKAQFLAFGSLYSNRETARCLSILPENSEEQKKLYSMYWDIDNRSTMIEKVGELSEGKLHTDIFSMEEFDLKNPIIQVILNKINNGMEFPLLTIEDFYQCKTILAWDLERGAILARNSVNIGYFRESEAYRYLEKISLKAQNEFKNWKEYIVSFICGRLIWSNYDWEEDFYDEISYNITNNFWGTYDQPYRKRSEQQPLYLEFPLSKIGKDVTQYDKFTDYGISLPQQISRELLIYNKDKTLQTHASPDIERVEKRDFWKSRGVTPISKALFATLLVGSLRYFFISFWVGFVFFIITIFYGVIILSNDTKNDIFKMHSIVPSVLCGENHSELLVMIPSNPRTCKEYAWLIYKIPFPENDFSDNSVGTIIPCVMDRHDGDNIETVIKKLEIHPLNYGFTKESIFRYAETMLNSHPIFPKEVEKFLTDFIPKCKSSDVIFLDENFNEVSSVKNIAKPW